ncbi:Cmx/CmrA family chloramphenicol efflux MFS transporter [Patulibacter sp. SYSU D01012]|uniref:Cmx/CmrA family chloramphenicol efflux MFS transporter n=1 Tax=Patulibacter sp. SYSU D01012 TaxID=2817381 RepID=UPI001B3156F0|nr:Cmx/CmrA family chloramphenicol efflux MFS transporter [Patulibacter sp. SYSU D01012]
MPAAVYLLGVAVFAQGTSEFMLAGLVSAIADSLDVSIARAGLMTSAFAVGMVVGAPLMALLSWRWPRRRALVAFLALFVAVHVVAALTTSFALLVATRVLGALANAGFLAVAIATVTGLVAPGAKGRALAVLLGGVTVACVVGVPAGALLGELWGWRAAFWAVALVSLPAIAATLWSVPTADATAAPPPPTRAGHELRALRRPRLLVALALGALVNGATFCSYTYLEPLLTGVAGVAPRWAPAMLGLFGLGAFVGVRASGRWADTRPRPLLLGGGVALALGWAALAALAAIAPLAIALTFALGALSFAVGSTLITRVLYAAEDAPTLGGSLGTAALNVGAAIGPWLGCRAMDAGLGATAAPWVSAALVALALATAAAGRAAASRSPAR